MCRGINHCCSRIAEKDLLQSYHFSVLKIFMAFSASLNTLVVQTTLKKNKTCGYYSKLTFIANCFVLRFLRFCCCYCGSLLKSSLNFLQYHFWFMFLVFWPRGMSGILAP